MIQQFIEAGILGLMCGLIAAVYRGVLAYEQPFSLWWKLGNHLENTWIFKPVWGCAKCFAGQLGFWIYFFQHGRWQERPPLSVFSAILPYSWTLEGYWLLGHLFTVAGAIFSAILFSYLIKHYNNEQ